MEENDTMNEAEAEAKAGLSDFTRKVLSLGLGAYFLTEEKLMGYVREAKLPKEIGTSITSNASKAKDEVLSFVTREIARVVKNVDIQDELDKLLARHKIKINAEIEFLPLDESAAAEAGSEEPRTPSKFTVQTTLTPKQAKAEEPPP